SSPPGTPRRPPSSTWTAHPGNSSSKSRPRRKPWAPTDSAGNKFGFVQPPLVPHKSGHGTAGQRHGRGRGDDHGNTHHKSHHQHRRTGVDLRAESARPALHVDQPRRHHQPGGQPAGHPDQRENRGVHHQRGHHLAGSQPESGEHAGL